MTTKARSLRSLRGASGVEYAIVAAIVLLALALGALVFSSFATCAIETAGTCIAGGDCSLKRCSTKGGGSSTSSVAPGVPIPHDDPPKPASPGGGGGGGGGVAKVNDQSDVTKCPPGMNAVRCKSEDGRVGRFLYIGNEGGVPQAGFLKGTKGDFETTVLGVEYKPGSLEANVFNFKYEPKNGWGGGFSVGHGELKLGGPALTPGLPINGSVSAFEVTTQYQRENPHSPNDFGVKLKGSLFSLGSNQSFALSDKDRDGSKEVTIEVGKGFGVAGVGVSVTVETGVVKSAGKQAVRFGRWVARR